MNHYEVRVRTTNTSHQKSVHRLVESLLSLYVRSLKRNRMQNPCPAVAVIYLSLSPVSVCFSSRLDGKPTSSSGGAGWCVRISASDSWLREGGGGRNLNAWLGCCFVRNMGEKRTFAAIRHGKLVRRLVLLTRTVGDEPDLLVTVELAGQLRRVVSVMLSPA